MSTARPARIARLVLIPALATPAFAQTAPSAEEQPSAAVQPEAAPGQESGRLDQTEPTETAGRDVARGVLLTPRGIIEVVLAPFRFGVWAEDRRKVSARWHETFYNDSGTFGVYPKLWFETGYGFRIGAQMDARPFSRDRLRAFAGTGLCAHSQRFDASSDVLGGDVQTHARRHTSRTHSSSARRRPPRMRSHASARSTTSRSPSSARSASTT